MHSGTERLHHSSRCIMMLHVNVCHQGTHPAWMSLINPSAGSSCQWLTVWLPLVLQAPGASPNAVPVVHRDLKPGNVVPITSLKAPFGIINQCRDGNMLSGISGVGLIDFGCIKVSWPPMSRFSCYVTSGFVFRHDACYNGDCADLSTLVPAPATSLTCRC